MGQVRAAAFEMNNHLTEEEIATYWARDAGESLKLRLSEHMSACDVCRGLAAAARRRKGDYPGMAFDLDRSIWLRAEHLDYEDKRAYASGIAGVEERAIAEAHLATCLACREELDAFLEDRLDNDQMLSVRHRASMPVPRIPRGVSQGFSPGFSMLPAGLWSPLRAAALILVAASLGLFVIRTGTGSGVFEYFKPEAAPGIESGAQGKLVSKAGLRGEDHGGRDGDVQAGVGPAAAETRVTLSDHGHRVVVEPRITGLSGADDAQLEAITGALIAEDIPLPSVVAELWGSEGALRGDRVNLFDLLRPRREIVRDTRPVFRWVPLKDASSYQVFIVDSRRLPVSSSGRLPADVTTWRPVVSLVRGESYWWSVSATVRGEEVISPGPAEAEWRFGVISEAEHRRLKRIEERTDSHLARGVLYARAGLISESERELQKLLDDNQDSNAVRKLLERVRSWR